MALVDLVSKGDLHSGVQMVPSAVPLHGVREAESILGPLLRVHLSPLREFCPETPSLPSFQPSNAITSFVIRFCSGLGKGCTNPPGLMTLN